MKFKGQCLTCKHWDGNRKAVHDHVETFNEDVMHPITGYASDGRCYVHYDFLNVDSADYASADITFDGNFGCVKWEAES